MGRGRILASVCYPRFTTRKPAHLSIQLRSWPFGLILLSLVAAALLVLLMANALAPSAVGDATVGQAIEMLFIAVALWTVLVVMLVVGGVMGSMPRWVAWLAIVLVPMAGVADVTAIDMCSRHMEWAIVLVTAFPLLIMSYAFWARLPRLQEALPAERTSVAVWGAIFFLSVVTFVVAAY
jgi:hypothetical protein